MASCTAFAAPPPNCWRNANVGAISHWLTKAWKLAKAQAADLRRHAEEAAATRRAPLPAPPRPSH